MTISKGIAEKYGHHIAEKVRAEELGPYLPNQPREKGFSQGLDGGHRMHRPAAGTGEIVK